MDRSAEEDPDRRQMKEDPERKKDEGEALDSAMRYSRATTNVGGLGEEEDGDGDSWRTPTT